MSKQFVRDLKDREAVESIFLAADKMILTDRNGKSYMSFNLADASGTINARIWEKVDEISKVFEPGDFVRVKGFVQTYQNRRQVIVQDLNKADSSLVALKDFVGAAVTDPQEMFDQLITLTTTFEDAHIRDLTLSVLNDAELKPRLLKAPAAKSIHHAYMGGLLEHVLSICGTMNFLASHYTFLNRDLLLFGAIFHDIGKVWELSIEDGIKYTDRGRLVGHMAIACEMIDEKSRGIFGFPVALKDALKHIVLSHHGKLEYGSPKEPAFPEAIVVAMIDDLDSKLNTVVGFMRQELGTGENWSRFHPQFDRYFYLDFLRGKERD
ncbi:MAG: 3'-5' exoribonuclease YhaM family protein [Bdellovibrionales bacterium]